MRDYINIVTKIKNTPWLILPESLAVILDIVDRRMNGEMLSDEEIRIRLDSAAGSNRTKSSAEAGGGVGVIPLYGPIFPKADLMTEMSGATSVETFQKDFRSLLNNDMVQTIIMDIDSPGGSSDMIKEMGTEIYEAREIKPIYAVANTVAGSAAYWLGSQATKFYATPSAQVGSIGVYNVHEDQSVKDANEGVKTTYISAGRFKVEGNPHNPLSQEGLEYRQQTVDKLYRGFVDAVAQGRGTSTSNVEANYGQGRVLLADDAFAVGMIDGIQTLDAVIDAALSGASLSASKQGKVAAKAGTSQQRLAQLISGKLDHRIEVAEWEHSEPGTGSPPEPRESPIERDVENGWRRDTPDDFVENPQAKHVEEGSNMREHLVAFASSLNITVTDDMTDEQLVTAIDASINDLNAEVSPLREARLEAEGRQQFSTAFPEEYERMQSLLERDRNMTAKEFASKFERFKKPDTDETTTYGFSSRVLTAIEDVHVKLAQKQLTSSDLENLLNGIGNNGIVDFSERGSSLRTDKEGNLVGEGRLAFAERVSEIMEEDKLDYSAAVKEAARRHPDEYDEYRSQVPTRKS